MPDTTKKPVIFLAFANDRDDTVGYLRNLPDEARRLRDVLQPAEQAGLCEVVVRSNSTAGDIFKVFQDPKYRNRIAIFHYGGHANGYQLLLESAAGQSNAADAGGLAAFLSQQQGLQLVFLNGCSTQQQTQGLLDANIPAVISTSRSIDDVVATHFACQFYQGLSSGATICTAFEEAAAATRTAKGSNTRALYFGDADDSQSHLEADRWPWNLYLREGSENADRWNLPEAVNDPLFGLPPLPEQDLSESPYRHLNRFTRKDAEVFFGRGYQIRELYDRLTAGTQPIILFYGQSGVGKSSLLDAGLIPRLEQNYEVRYLRRRAGGLLDTLQLAFLPEASDMPIESAWLAKEEQLKKPLIVFLDQVEEFYTRPITDLPDELDQLLRVVKATFNDPNRRPLGKLVLGFREEWLARLGATVEKHQLPNTKMFLKPLDRDGIIEAVQGPARSARLRERYALSVEEGLAEIIADNLLADRGSAISTTLQILLSKMWAQATEEISDPPQFSQDLYLELKKEGILLGDFLDQQLKAFHSRSPASADSGLLLDVLAMHTTDLGSANECSQENLLEEYGHVGDELPSLLRECQDLYLLTETASTQKESTKTTRLAHDTLAPLVRDKFDKSDKPGQRARRILDNRSVDWVGDETGAPLDEADLTVVDQGLVGTRALSPAEQSLVSASRTQRTGRKKTRRNLKILGTVVVAAVLVLVVAIGVVWYTAGQDRANKLLVDLSSVDEGRVFHVVAEMKTEFAWLRKDLEADVESDSIEPERKTRALIALAANDPSRMEELWRAFKNLDEPINRRRRFLAGLAIARYDRQLNRFSDEDVEFLANELLASATKNQRNYRNYLGELSGRLILPLEREFYAPRNAECGIHAAMALLDFASGDVNRIVELATNANPTQFNDVLFPAIEDFDRSVVLRKLVAVIDNDDGNPNTNDQKSTPLNRGKRRAGAAIALLRLGSRDWDRVFDALRIYDDSSSLADPEPLTQFIHGCKDRGLRTATLIESIERACALRETFDAADRKREDSVLFALLLSLGEFDYDQLDIPDAERERFVGRLQQLFATDPSSAIHGATRWLMQHWELPLKEEVVPYSPGREWYTIKLDKRRMQDNAGDSRNAQDGYFLTFIVFEPGVYPIGSFQNSGRDVADYPKFDEHLHIVRITRAFAVLDREITALEFEESGLHEPATQVFENEVFLGRNYTRLSKPLDRPMINVCWYEAVKFCRWLTEALSESDVVEPEQAYQHPDQLDPKRYPVDPVGWGLESRCNWPVRLECRGYRLPTEAEWEIACRAATRSPYSFGSDQELLKQYHGGNAGEIVQERANEVNKWHVVRHFRPNLRGLFGMYGKVREWCHDLYGPYLTDAEVMEIVDPVGPPHNPNRVIRGGRSDFGGFHSSNRNRLRAGGWSIDLGFRIAQTLDEPVQP